MSKLNKDDINQFADDILEKLGKRVIKKARRNCVHHDSIASAELIRGFYLNRVAAGKWRVGNNAPYSAVIEYGRHPSDKMPPVDKIERWIKEKKSIKLKRVRKGGHYQLYYIDKEGTLITSRKWSPDKPKRKFDLERGMAWAISKKIQKEGFEAKPFMRPALYDELNKFRK